MPPRTRLPQLVENRTAVHSYGSRPNRSYSTISLNITFLCTRFGLPRRRCSSSRAVIATSSRWPVLCSPAEGTHGGTDHAAIACDISRRQQPRTCPEPAVDLGDQSSDRFRCVEALPKQPQNLSLGNVPPGQHAVRTGMRRMTLSKPCRKLSAAMLDDRGDARGSARAICLIVNNV